MAYAFNDDKSKLKFPLPVANGGTGATSAPNARSNLNAVGCSNASKQNPMLTSLNSAGQHWTIRSIVINDNNETYENHDTGLALSDTDVFGFDFTAQKTLWHAYTTKNKPSFSDIDGVLPISKGGTGATTLSGMLSNIGIKTLTKTESSIAAGSNRQISWDATELKSAGIDDLSKYCIVSVMSRSGSGMWQSTHMVSGTDAYPYARMNVTSGANQLYAHVYNSGNSAANITVKVVLLKIA